MDRTCSQCGTKLNQYNDGTLCVLCQDKESEKLTTGDRSHYDAEDMARLLGLKSAEQVRWLARNKKLPAQIPAVRRWLWLKEVVDRWMKSGGPLAQGSTEQLAALADAHGGWHFDKASKQWRLGEPEVVSPMVSDKSGSKMEIYTQFSPQHSESS
jgi:hypothetical protein